MCAMCVWKESGRFLACTVTGSSDECVFVGMCVPCMWALVGVCMCEHTSDHLSGCVCRCVCGAVMHVCVKGLVRLGLFWAGVWVMSWLTVKSLGSHLPGSQAAPYMSKDQLRAPSLPDKCF